MQELIIIDLPNGQEWEMPAYLAKKLYDFIKKVPSENNETYKNYELEWLSTLPLEDQLKVNKNVRQLL